MDKLKKLMSLCKCSVSIDVNGHRDYYMTAEQKINEVLDVDAEAIEPEMQQKMIKADTIISIHFYPRTPISFYCIYDCDIDNALDKALSCFDED